MLIIYKHTDIETNVKKKMNPSQNIFLWELREKPWSVRIALYGGVTAGPPIRPRRASPVSESQYKILQFRHCGGLEGGRGEAVGLRGWIRQLVLGGAEEGQQSAEVVLGIEEIALRAQST